MGLFKKLFEGITGSSVVQDISNAADQLFTSKEEKLEFERLAQEAESKHQQKLIELAQEAEAQHLRDRQNAREMQMQALKQNDKFSKRFVYVLAVLILVAAIAFGVILLYVDIPAENRRMIEMFADIFLFTGAVTVIQFFFGSSRGSDEKNSIIEKQKQDGT